VSLRQELEQDIRDRPKLIPVLVLSYFRLRSAIATMAINDGIEVHPPLVGGIFGEVGTPESVPDMVPESSAVLDPPSRVPRTHTFISQINRSQDAAHAESEEQNPIWADSHRC
jgi:hypothetical protein